MTDESGAPELPQAPTEALPETNDPAFPTHEGIGGPAVESTVHAPGTTFEPTTAETGGYQQPSQPPNETNIAPENAGEQREAPVISKMIGNIQANNELSQEEKDQLETMVNLVNEEAPLDERDPDALKSQAEKLDQTMKDIIRTLLIVSGYRKVIGPMGTGMHDTPLSLLDARSRGSGKYDLGRTIGEVNPLTLGTIRRNIGVLLGSKMPEDQDYEGDEPVEVSPGVDRDSPTPFNSLRYVTGRAEMPAGSLGLTFREFRSTMTSTGEVGRYFIVADPPGWPNEDRSELAERNRYIRGTRGY